MLAYGRLVVVMLLCVVGWSYTTAQEIMTVDMTIFVDRDSLTVYVPGNQPVSLQDVGFQVIQGEQTVTRFLQEYPAFGVDWGRVQPPVCFRLIRQESDSVPPLECNNIQLFTQNLPDANIFWYDNLRRQPFTFSIVRGINQIETCPAQQAACPVRFEVSTTIVTTPEPTPTPVVPAINAWVQITGACADAALDGLNLDADRFVTADDGASYPLVVRGRCHSERLLDLTINLNARRLDQVVEPDSFTISDVSFRQGANLLEALESYVSGGDYLDTAAQLTDLEERFDDAEQSSPMALLRSNSLLFAGCYDAAIEGYGQSVELDSVWSPAILNNRGVARAVLALAQRRGDRTPDDCPNVEEAVASDATWQTLLDAALDDFDSVFAIGDADTTALAHTNRGWALMWVADNRYDEAEDDCTHSAIDAAGVSARTRALADMCLAATYVSEVINSVAVKCDIDKLDIAEELLDNPALHSTEAQFWRGMRAYTASYRNCTSAASRQADLRAESEAAFHQFFATLDVPGAVVIATTQHSVFLACMPPNLSLSECRRAP